MVIIADDGTTPKLLKVDSNRYLYVSIMGGFFSPQTEFKAGSDCSGSDGGTSRVLTLSNASLSSQELVVVDGTVYRKDTDYTMSHLAASSTVTFLGKIWDSQKIEVRYFI